MYCLSEHKLFIDTLLASFLLLHQMSLERPLQGRLAEQNDGEMRMNQLT